MHARSIDNLPIDLFISCIQAVSVGNLTEIITMNLIVITHVIVLTVLVRHVHGEACDAATSCSEGGQCINGTCMRPDNAPCEVWSECMSKKCSGKLCVAKDYCGFSYECDAMANEICSLNKCVKKPLDAQGIAAFVSIILSVLVLVILTCLIVCAMAAPGSRLAVLGRIFRSGNQDESEDYQVMTPLPQRATINPSAGQYDGVSIPSTSATPTKPADLSQTSTPTAPRPSVSATPRPSVSQA